MINAEIIGNVGSDAVMKDGQFGNHIEFTIASDNGKDKPATWVNVHWYNFRSGLVQYIQKGAKLFVRGSLTASTYAGQDGQQRVGLSINAREVDVVIFPKRDAAAAPAQAQAPVQQQAQEAPAQEQQPINPYPWAGTQGQAQGGMQPNHLFDQEGNFIG